jgi:predicted nucleic acid-binding protein
MDDRVMEIYTTDAVGLIRYLVDQLPNEANAVFTRAEAGEVILQLPVIAAVETLYRLDKREHIKGVPIDVSSNEIIEGLRSYLPVTVVRSGMGDIAAVATLVSDLSTHDAMIVASHQVRETDGIITRDPEIAELDVPIVWN